MTILRNKVNHYTHWHFNKFVLEEIKKNDEVLEIGSGFGEYTFEIAKKTKTLTSIEIDKYKYNFQTEFSDLFNYKNLTIINNDFVSFKKEKRYDVILFCQSIGFFDNEIIKNSIDKLLKKEGKVIILDLIDNNIFNFNRKIMKRKRKGQNLIYYALKDAESILINGLSSQNKNKFIKLVDKHSNILKKIKYDSSFFDIYKYTIKNANDLQYIEKFFKTKKEIYFGNIFLIPIILILNYKFLNLISKLNLLFNIKFLSFKYVKVLSK